MTNDILIFIHTHTRALIGNEFCICNTVRHELFVAQNDYYIVPNDDYFRMLIDYY